MRLLCYVVLYALLTYFVTYPVANWGISPLVEMLRTHPLNAIDKPANINEQTLIIISFWASRAAWLFVAFIVPFLLCRVLKRMRDRNRWRQENW